MMRLHELTNSHRPSKRTKLLGRGVGSGRGKTSGRGHKGFKSRSGYKTKPGYEGGQTPLYRRVPIRGSLVNRFREDVFVIGLDALDRIFEEGQTVSFNTLIEKGILPKSAGCRVKVLSNGQLTKKLIFENISFSKTAEQQLKDAGMVI